ncbi:hypothetical protein FHX06_006280 [Rhizobium sp. BK512]|nr:hypothetical protein [Rhizobium sp. BK512]
MKSERHAARISLRCSSVGACATATPVRRLAAQMTLDIDNPNWTQRPLRRIADREDAYIRIVPLPEKFIDLGHEKKYSG